MTASFNLSQLANNLNTSGQLDATDGLNGLVANSNLASSGSPSSSTYLRGDRSWANLPALGKVLQIQQAVKTDIYTQTISSFTGVPGLSVDITPSSASSKILVMFSINVGVGGNAGLMAVYRNGSIITGWRGDAAPGVTSQGIFNYYNNADNNSQFGWNSQYLDSPGTTSTQTYQIYLALPQGGGTAVVNFLTSLAYYQTYSTAGCSTITVMEIGA